MSANTPIPNEILLLTVQVDESPPSWDGIIAGTTSVHDAALLLHNNPSVTDVENIAGLTGRYASSSLYWKGSGYTANALYFPNSATVHAVSVYLSDGIFFSAIRKAYGDPTHLYIRTDIELGIALGYDGAAYTISAVYLNHGFVIDGAVLSADEVTKHLEEVEFKGQNLVFFRPNDKRAFSLAYLTWPVPGDYLVEWRNGWTVQDYCLEAYKNNSLSDCLQ